MRRKRRRIVETIPTTLQEWEVLDDVWANIINGLDAIEGAVPASFKVYPLALTDTLACDHHGQCRYSPSGFGAGRTGRQISLKRFLELRELDFNHPRARDDVRQLLWRAASDTYEKALATLDEELEKTEAKIKEAFGGLIE